MLAIKGLAGLAARLQALNASSVMAQSLAAQAEVMAAAVRAGLSAPPGSGGHERPWRQSGALQESISVRAEGLDAVVGSNDPAAAPQEMGTIHLPPRPFLAPVAAATGGAVAGAVGIAVADAVRDGVTATG